MGLTDLNQIGVSEYCWNGELFTPVQLVQRTQGVMAWVSIPTVVLLYVHLIVNFISYNKSFCIRSFYLPVTMETT